VPFCHEHNNGRSLRTIFARHGEPHGSSALLIRTGQGRHPERHSGRRYALALGVDTGWLTASKLLGAHGSCDGGHCGSGAEIGIQRGLIAGVYSDVREAHR
jgi:hypothetical protein